MENDILDSPGVTKNLISKFPALKFYLIGLASFFLLQLVPFGCLYLHILSISSDSWFMALSGIILLSIFISAPSISIAILTACFSFSKSKGRHENLVNAAVLVLSVVSLIAGGYFTAITWR